jgi:GT2 family glycosyltransferase
VVVVAGDEYSAAVAAEYDVTVVRVPNRNAATSRNAGWRAATTEFVGFLDDDCIPAPDWAGVAQAALTEPAGAQAPAAVGGHVSNPRPDLLVARVAQQWLGRRFPPGPAQWLATQNLATRRSLLQELEGFDENLVAYEDVDFSLRVAEFGGQLLRVPGMDVMHEHRSDVRAMLAQHRGYGRGLVQLSRKNPDWDGAGRAPLTPLSSARALSLAALRPIVCAWGMPQAGDRVRALPLFLRRELAFLHGAVAETRRSDATVPARR